MTPPLLFQRGRSGFGHFGLFSFDALFTGDYLCRLSYRELYQLGAEGLALRTVPVAVGGDEPAAAGSAELGGYGVGKFIGELMTFACRLAGFAPAKT